jgi:hypothetical protein
MQQLVEQDKRFSGIKKVDQVYRFLNPDSLTETERNDPDIRLKYLERQFGNMNPISCSKCHHCR